MYLILWVETGNNEARVYLILWENNVHNEARVYLILWENPIDRERQRGAECLPFLPVLCSVSARFCVISALFLPKPHYNPVGRWDSR